MADTNSIQKTPFFLECDLSTAESRVVYVLTGDQHLIDLARTLPWEYDMHKAEASAIFKVPEEQVTDKQRYEGKRTVHGAQRDMGGKTMSDKLLKESGGDPDMIKTEEECQGLIDAYHMARPQIKSVYFDGIMHELWDNRKLTNSWGREIRWPYAEFDANLYRKGYSFKPQSEIGDLLNQWGLIPIYHLLKKHKLKSRINTQTHDSLLFSTNFDECYWIMWQLKQSLERPRKYGGHDLSIPTTFTIGTTWKGTHEWKKFPTENEFRERAWAMLCEQHERKPNEKEATQKGQSNQNTSTSN